LIKKRERQASGHERIGHYVAFSPCGVDRFLSRSILRYAKAHGSVRVGGHSVITTLERKTSRRDNNMSMSGMTEEGPTKAINHVLQDAKDAHEAGRLDEADSLYRSVLEQTPKHP
jgi:hypothetical protein